jgi:AcrR family transcriptional regulator
MIEASDRSFASEGEVNVLSNISVDQELSTKERIFNMAVNLFLEKGFFETSVRELAQASRIRVSSLYNHYSSKEAILEDILTFFKNNVEKEMIDEEKIEAYVDSLPPRILLTRGFAKIVQSVKPSIMDKIYHIIVIELYRNPKVRKFYDQYSQHNTMVVKKLFTVMQEKNLIKDINPDFLADAYIALINYYYSKLFLYKADYGDTKEIEKEIEQRLHCFVDMVVKLG